MAQDFEVIPGEPVALPVQQHRDFSDLVAQYNLGVGSSQGPTTVMSSSVNAHSSSIRHPWKRERCQTLQTATHIYCR